jgi:hypothetical protein
VIRTSVSIAATTGAEPIATGEVLEGPPSAARRSASVGPSWIPTGAPILPWSRTALVDRTITCPDGTVRMGFTPEEPQGQTQTGSWTIVSGTGAFEGLRGSGEMEVAYDPDDTALGRETFTGTVTR